MQCDLVTEEGASSAQDFGMFLKCNRMHAMLSKNVGLIDRILRIVVGLGLISLVFVGPQTPWGWIGVVPLLTAVISFCPLYTLIGIRTCPIGNK
jgi:hypothetical protein